MLCDVYKKTAIAILASLKNKENAVVSVSTSNSIINTVEVARELVNSFISMDLSVTLVNAKVEGNEEISISTPKKINEKLSEVLFESKSGVKITSLSAKAAIDEIKTSANITVIAIDEIANSAPAMMIASCCDGVILAERKNLSRRDNIENAIEVINNICVKPIGFILV